MSLPTGIGENNLKFSKGHGTLEARVELWERFVSSIEQWKPPLGNIQHDFTLECQN